jgi:hypothetical protein
MIWKAPLTINLQMRITLHCAIHWQHLALMVGIQIAEIHEEILFIG